jgi:hypothetical protein
MGIKKLSKKVLLKKENIMIYIGNFLHVTNQEEPSEEKRRHGEFNLFVEADSKEAAIDMFRESIFNYRQQSHFFEGDCAIYFVELLEFENFPQTEAKILNYKSIAGDPLMPYIACSVPSQETDACRIYDWTSSEPEVDGSEKKLFISFKNDKSA